ncbi:MAG: UDP-N-acetylmuramoyl-tripeptide--D-alanyl-D-alanine ligase [Candidatus Peribacter sp.]|jgi:UDP-N-acetylmuramoyl-tripeptide--D-alanyl-D-alanine ligase|nr:UDP-N-acetylmuramoyl-tripeptide--D-alanyl-D-alanine ligase [Candidatus Peribacter sp.]
MDQILIFGLLLAASASPLLTFASLWQIKEWRTDRLREHLRSAGILKQLLGIVRPAILILGIVLRNIDIALIGLALFSASSIGLRRQRYPVWTMKARILVTVSLIITGGMSYGLLIIDHWLLIGIPLLQPVSVLVAWTLFLPIDRTMKNRIMKKASDLRAQFSQATVVGITGSVGKTTTKELIAHILKDRNVLCTPAYVNSEMGVSQWLLKELPSRDRDEELVIIVEMGAYRTGEIKKLCSVTKPAMGVITFIGSQHIALFGSQERLCQAKGELLESLPEDGKAFINGDNSLCESMKDKCRCAITSVGTGGHADLEAFDIEETGDGIRFKLDQQHFSLNLHGTHNVTNILLAIAVAEKLGLDRASSAARLRSFEPPHHTFSVHKHGSITVLDDTHNASPSSFRASLAWAKSQPMGQKILITPGLIELGRDEDRIHRELGTASNGIIDRVIFTGKHGRNAFAEGFNGSVETFGKEVSAIKEGDLLLCVGRVSQKHIDRLIP